MLPRLFRRDWNELEAEDVEAFLADAGEEPLLWEAKGGARPHPGAVRKAVCGFANARGGYLIIGAEPLASGGWGLPGVEFAGEAGTWLSSVVTTGMSPVPDFDVKVFDRSGRKAAVVRVEPVAVPPCITSDGIVFQRVSGQTPPVTDQRVLGDLTARGDAARAQAEAKALRAVRRILKEPGLYSERESELGLALCPVAGPKDRAALLFDKTVAGAFQGLVFRELQADPTATYSYVSRIRQDSIQVRTASGELGHGWTATAYWDGAVAAVYSNRGTEGLLPNELITRVARGWRVLAQVAGLLRGTGATHFAALYNGRHPGAMYAKRGVPHEPAQRWTESPEPHDDDIARVQRELQRGFGQEAWEPATGA